MDWLFLLINWTKRKVLLKTRHYYIVMSQIKSVLDLCENLANVNLRICNQIKHGGLNEEILYKYFKNTAEEFKKYSKNLKSSYGISNESNCTEENDEWKEMEDENDELIDRLNRLKQVVPDFEESKFEEFDEPEFEEFHEPEFEDFEVPNEFEELNKDANELLMSDGQEISTIEWQELKNRLPSFFDQK